MRKFAQKDNILGTFLINKVQKKHHKPYIWQVMSSNGWKLYVIWGVLHKCKNPGCDSVYIIQS